MNNKIEGSTRIIDIKAITKQIGGHASTSEWNDIMDACRNLLDVVDKIKLNRKLEDEAVLTIHGVHNQVSPSGKGSKSASLDIEEFIGSYKVERKSKGKGSRGASVAKDPTLFSTYKSRVSVVQSTARALKLKDTNFFKFTEKDVSIIAERFTAKYNETFGTNFETYHSKRGYSAKRDGARI